MRKQSLVFASRRQTWGNFQCAALRKRQWNSFAIKCNEKAPRQLQKISEKSKAELPKCQQILASAVAQVRTAARWHAGAVIVFDRPIINYYNQHIKATRNTGLGLRESKWSYSHRNIDCQQTSQKRTGIVRAKIIRIRRRRCSTFWASYRKVY